MNIQLRHILYAFLLNAFLLCDSGYARSLYVYDANFEQVSASLDEDLEYLYQTYVFEGEDSQEVIDELVRKSGYSQSELEAERELARLRIAQQKNAKQQLEKLEGESSPEEDSPPARAPDSEITRLLNTYALEDNESPEVVDELLKRLECSREKLEEIRVSIKKNHALLDNQVGDRRFASNGSKRGRLGIRKEAALIAMAAVLLGTIEAYRERNEITCSFLGKIPLKFNEFTDPKIAKIKDALGKVTPQFVIEAKNQIDILIQALLNNLGFSRQAKNSIDLVESDEAKKQAPTLDKPESFKECTAAMAAYATSGLMLGKASPHLMPNMIPAEVVQDNEMLERLIQIVALFLLQGGDGVRMLVQEAFEQECGVVKGRLLLYTFWQVVPVVMCVYIKQRNIAGLPTDEIWKRVSLGAFAEVGSIFGSAAAGLIFQKQLKGSPLMQPLWAALSRGQVNSLITRCFARSLQLHMYHGNTLSLLVKFQNDDFFNKIKNSDGAVYNPSKSNILPFHAEKIDNLLPFLKQEGFDQSKVPQVDYYIKEELKAFADEYLATGAFMAMLATMTHTIHSGIEQIGGHVGRSAIFFKIKKVLTGIFADDSEKELTPEVEVKKSSSTFKKIQRVLAIWPLWAQDLMSRFANPLGSTMKESPFVARIQQAWNGDPRITKYYRICALMSHRVLANKFYWVCRAHKNKRSSTVSNFASMCIPFGIWYLSTRAIFEHDQIKKIESTLSLDARRERFRALLAKDLFAAEDDFSEMMTNF